MSTYKCPYCGKNNYSTQSARLFESWEDVQKHARACKLSTKQYMICPFYGPINKDVLNNYSSIVNFRKDYPLNKFSTSQWYRLRKEGSLTIPVKRWTKAEIISAIQSFVKENNRVPQQIDFINSKYPGFNTVQRRFGSWNKGVEAAGFETSLNHGFGIKTRAKDGMEYKSKSEAFIVDNLLYNKFTYEYEKPYGNGWFSDFYLPDYNLYLEVDGNLRPERTAQKLKYFNDNNINYIFIDTRTMYQFENIEKQIRNFQIAK